MSVTRIAVIEDDAQQRERIVNYLKQYEAEKDASFRVRAFQSGEDFLTSQWSRQYDLLLVDIQMEPVDGMTMAEEVRRTDTDVMIVFVTQLSSYAVQGYSVRAFDFLVKPIDYDFFERKMDGILAVCARKEGKTVRFRTVQGGLLRLEPADILYVEMSNRKLFVHTPDAVYQCNMTMQDAESSLGDTGFFRCHASFLVNLKYVKRIGKEDCCAAEELLPVSRHRRKEFLEAINLYMSRRD